MFSFFFRSVFKTKLKVKPQEWLFKTQKFKSNVKTTTIQSLKQMELVKHPTTCRNSFRKLEVQLWVPSSSLLPWWYRMSLFPLSWGYMASPEIKYDEDHYFTIIRLSSLHFWLLPAYILKVQTFGRFMYFSILSKAFIYWSLNLF